MPSFLRTASRRTLLSAIAAAVALVAGCAAIAVAAGSGGPVPARRALPVAIHRALAAPAVQGITARISFTNSLISSSELQGSDPLLNGGSGRLWLDPARHRLRVEVQGENGDAQLVVDRGSFWVYDPSGNQVFTGTLPAQESSTSGADATGVPSVTQISKWLAQLSTHLHISGANPSDVAGQAAYTVRVSPRADGGLLGAVQLSWDAARGVPLRFTVFAKGSSSPVLELKATHISYGFVPAGDFTAAAPRGARVTRLGALGGSHKSRKPAAPVTGLSAVSAKAPFTVDAPTALAGFPRGEVRLLGSGAGASVVVGYGQGLDGVLVIEHAASAKRPSLSTANGGGDQGGDGSRGLSIPTISINGISASELQTALGTALQFQRAGVSYTVLGSVPAKVAESAARGL